MVTILFWNINGKPLLARLARLAAREAADVVILAECAAAPADVAAALNTAPAHGWIHLPSVCERFRAFTRLPAGAVVEQFTEIGGRMNVWKVQPGPEAPVLLAAVHLVSKFGWKPEDQLDAARPLAEELELEEGRQPNRGTVVVGDFNMNPYDPGLISSSAFHATMTRRLAEQRSRRVVQGRPQRKAFFNPMWRFMTDRDGSPAGTYYWDAAIPSNHYWYTLDHVLVRPELADKLNRVTILDHDGTDPLTVPGDGRPDALAGSDHLPVLVALDI